MERALQLEPEKLYSRHVAAADRGSWSILSDVRWGDIDARRARCQPEVLDTVRRLVLAISARGARTARLLACIAADPHASAALTLELWDGLKHVHALRTYLDAVGGERISDEELSEARRAPIPAHPGSVDEAVVELLFLQHAFAAALRHAGSRAEEPVLAELLSLIAADESRHVQIASDLLALRLDTGTSSREAITIAAERMRRFASDWPVDDLTARAFTLRLEGLCQRSAASGPQSSSNPLLRT